MAQCIRVCNSTLRSICFKRILLISKQVKNLYKWTSIEDEKWNIYNEWSTHTVRKLA